MLPYGRQRIDEDDIAAVVEVLRSDWLTTGPKVGEFEEAFAEFVGAKYALAVSSGTAALHTIAAAMKIRPGDEVIFPPLTFVSTVSAFVQQEATPIFADIDNDTLLIDPERIKEKITNRTLAIVGVDYAGLSCNWDALKAMAVRHNLCLIADSCHGLEFNGTDAAAFSFHPVKHLTTGEGGMIVTNSPTLAKKARILRNNGIGEKCGWHYDVSFLGLNYRMSDIHAALGLSQLKKVRAWTDERQMIALRYDEALKDIRKQYRPSGQVHSYHLYVVRLGNRDEVFTVMREKGIGVQVHYIPVHLHSYYRKRFPSFCPVAETVYKELLSLPIYPGLTIAEQDYVIEVFREAYRD